MAQLLLFEEAGRASLIEATDDPGRIGALLSSLGAGLVAELRVQRGDLVRVPAGARHWFDAGDPPVCTALRPFTRPDGWVGGPTGDTIVSRFVGPPAVHP